MTGQHAKSAIRVVEAPSLMSQASMSWLIALFPSLGLARRRRQARSPITSPRRVRPFRRMR